MSDPLSVSGRLDAMQAVIQRQAAQLATLKAQRDELLTACKRLVDSFGHYGTDYGSTESDIKVLQRARAAIAAVEKEAK